MLKFFIIFILKRSLQKPLKHTSPRWITALDHEVGDDPMEDGVVVVPTGSQVRKVATRLWRMLPVQLDVDAAHPGKDQRNYNVIKQFQRSEEAKLNARLYTLGTL